MNEKFSNDGRHKKARQETGVSPKDSCIIIAMELQGPLQIIDQKMISHQQIAAATEFKHVLNLSKIIFSLCGCLLCLYSAMRGTRLKRQLKDPDYLIFWLPISIELKPITICWTWSSFHFISAVNTLSKFPDTEIRTTGPRNDLYSFLIHRIKTKHYKMIAGCALGNENCFETWRLNSHCFKTLSHGQNFSWRKKIGKGIFPGMVMNDLMGKDKSKVPLPLFRNGTIKGDLKLIVREWKYRRGRMH